MRCDLTTAILKAGFNVLTAVSAAHLWLLLGILENLCSGDQRVLISSEMYLTTCLLYLSENMRSCNITEI